MPTIASIGHGLIGKAQDLRKRFQSKEPQSQKFDFQGASNSLRLSAALEQTSAKLRGEVLTGNFPKLMIYRKHLSIYRDLQKCWKNEPKRYGEILQKALRISDENRLGLPEEIQQAHRKDLEDARSGLYRLHSAFRLGFGTDELLKMLVCRFETEVKSLEEEIESSTIKNFYSLRGIQEELTELNKKCEPIVAKWRSLAEGANSFETFVKDGSAFTELNQALLTHYKRKYSDFALEIFKVSASQLRRWEEELKLVEENTGAEKYASLLSRKREFLYGEDGEMAGFTFVNPKSELNECRRKIAILERVLNHA